ncbi:hypothetical protein PUN28_020075 [Cardiocondyla obscurior]|uniref:Uncharacterized protein n=2 Tax=Cardiocondyla obscurior TaxID=286306 RepID=A0AAW2E6D4_9HYME
MQERPAMCRNRTLITAMMALLLYSETISITDATIYRFLHDIIEYNLAGIPAVHEKTEWNFDPEVGKLRRIRYEQENGHFGEYAIEKLGKGIGYGGSWGKLVKV